MKKVFLVSCMIACLSYPLLVFSQPIPIDVLKYRVTYETKSVCDTTQLPYIYEEDEMRLDIGEMGVSMFYSFSVQHRIDVIQSQLASGVADWDQVPKKGCIGWILYKNYPERGKTLMTETVGMTEYQCEEAEPSPVWTMVPDSTAEILGYQCQQAVTWFKGRKWYVWYTDDVPINEGPWKLNGLPGLVFRAHDSQYQFCFEAIGIEQPESRESIVYTPSKRERVSPKDLRKLKRSYSLAAELAGMGLNKQNFEHIPEQKMNPIDLDD